MSKHKTVKGPATPEARAKLSRKMKRIWAARRAAAATSATSTTSPMSAPTLEAPLAPQTPGSADGVHVLLRLGEMRQAVAAANGFPDDVWVFVFRP